MKIKEFPARAKLNLKRLKKASTYRVEGEDTIIWKYRFSNDLIIDLSNRFVMLDKSDIKKINSTDYVIVNNALGIPSEEKSYINLYYFDIVDDIAENKRKVGIEEFKKGYFYRIPGGLKDRPYYFNSEGEMDFMMSGDWFKCVISNGSSAILENVKPKHLYNKLYFSRSWSWECVMDIMEESSYITTENIDKKEEKIYNEEVKERKVKNFNQMVNSVATMNKDNARQATLIKVGKTANDTVSNLIKGKVPKKYRKIMDTPFADLVIANAAAIALQNMAPTNREKIDTITNAMVLASMIDITNMIDVNAIAKQLVDSVDLSGLVPEKE